MAQKIISLAKIVRTKYKRYSILAIALIIFGIYKLFGSSTPVEEISFSDIYTVKSGSIQNSIKVLGTTDITDQQILTFGQEGTVKNIYVKEGQYVKKGDLLAELDKKDLSNNMAQQSLSIQNARINYQKLLTQYTEGDKVKAQNAVSDIEAKLKIANQELQDLMDERGSTLKTNGNQAQSVIISTKGIINDAKDILETVDQIFGFTSKNKLVNNNIAIYLSAKAPSYKTMTEQYFYEATKKLNEVETAISMIQATTTTTRTTVEGLQLKAKDMLNSFSSLVENGANATKNSISSDTLTQSKIDSRTSTLNSSKSKILSSISSINSSNKTLKDSNIEIQSKQNEIKNYEAQLQINKESLQTILNGAKSEDVQLQINNIKQMQISMSQLSDQSENYEIRAPFDGNIDIVSIKKGDNITMDNISDKSITISNPNIYQIDMLIDQVDIVKIEKGQLAEITFDSYPEYLLTGTISDIDPTPVTNAGVVSYTAKINMIKGDKKIYDSMTTNIKIITEKKDNIIVIPTSAIQTLEEKSAVQIMKGINAEKKVIELGISDGTNSEVTTGISVGDKILLKEYKVNTTTTKTTTQAQDGRVKAQQSTRGLGVGGNSAGGFGGPGM